MSPGTDEPNARADLDEALSRLSRWERLRLRFFGVKVPSAGYAPSNPPSAADWQRLEERADENLRRGRRGQRIATVAVVLVVVCAAVAVALWLPQRDVPKVLDKQTETLRATNRALVKINEIVVALQAAGAAQAAGGRATAGLLANTLDLLADNFATPPAPDPARLRAVQGLRDAATAICASLPAPKPLGCPPAP